MAFIKNRRHKKIELPGLEPRQTDSESVVLPLHHSSVRSQIYKKKGRRQGLFSFGRRGIGDPLPRKRFSFGEVHCQHLYKSIHGLIAIY